MLYAHKIIDTMNLMLKGERPSPVPGAIRFLPRVIANLRAAEKFFFDIPLEITGEKENGIYTFGIPGLTQDEWGFWKDGLIPLPAPRCWFEFRLNGRTYPGLLISENDSGVDVERIEYGPPVPGMSDGVMFTGMAVSELKEPDGTRVDKALALAGNRDALPFLAAQQGGEQGIKDYACSVFQLMVYMALMLNSKTTEISTERAPERLNRARIKGGVSPLFDHRIVRIVPERFMREAREASGGHRSPRLHWRRSHPRTLYRGTDKERRIVIPRFLVGRAETGVVTHEYHVTTHRKAA